MKWIIFLLLFSLAAFFSSCCGLRKTKTTIVTETVYQVDTVIQVRIDTVVRTVTGYLYDTVRIENQVAEARTYFDITKQRIVLELKGKQFGVPVKVNKVVTTNSKNTNVERPFNYAAWAIGFGILIMMLIVIAKLIDTFKK